MAQPSVKAEKRDDGRVVGALLALIVLIGAIGRLAFLGESALRADTITFWNICRMPNVTPGGIFEHWMDLMGVCGQFPFPMAFTKWFIDLFHLPYTHFTIRLPSAIWGILTVPAAFAMGRRLGGARLGLLAALLLAVSPFHLQVSREAYFYPPMVLGAFLCVWAVMIALDPDRARGGVSWVLAVVTAVGFFLLTYSQPSGWTLAFLCLLAIFGGEARRLWNNRRIRFADSVLPAALFLMGLPLLFSRWALPHLRENASGAAKESALKALATSEGSAWTLVEQVATSFAWGSTPVRLAFTLAVVALGLYALLAKGRKDIRCVSIPVFIVGLFVLYLIARASTGAMYEARYMLSALPFYLLWMAMGLRSVGPLLARINPRAAGWGQGLVMALALALLLPPAYWSMRLTGKPTPYKLITEWVDANLPRGAPVLVDRWFEPWNELAVYASTNASYAFTIPNEPVDVFLKYGWRKTAEDFLTKFPDAAYLEIAKEYWDVDGVGPWEWPRTFFARRVTLTNEAGLKLREVGLCMRGDFYVANTNRLIVDLFYNTPEDVVARARAAGKKTVLWYGPNWGYTKLWRQIQGDFRDWRVVEGPAVLDLYNLTDEPLTATPVVRGVALNAARSATAMPGMQSFTFPAGRIVDWTWKPVELAPGLNRFTLAVDGRSVRDAPLLIEAIRVEASP